NAHAEQRSAQLTAQVSQLESEVARQRAESTKHAQLISAQTAALEKLRTEQKAAAVEVGQISKQSKELTSLRQESQQLQREVQRLTSQRHEDEQRTKLELASLERQLEQKRCDLA